MHVGVVMSGFAPECGGAHTFEQELVAALARHGASSRHRFELFACRTPPTVAPDHPTLRVHRITRGEKLAARCRAAASRQLGLLTRHGRRARRFNRRTHWLEYCLAASGVELVWFLSPAPLALDLPYITIVWDLQHRRQPFFPEVSRELEWDTREAAYAATLRRATVVIAGTQIGKDEIERFYQVQPERIRILPHPTPRFALEPPALDEEAVLARFQLPPRFLFYPAQFWPHKNHVNLLRALQILHSLHGERLPLVLSGSDQGNRGHVEQCVAELGLQDQVRFLGFVSRDELMALYRRALALIYPTFFGPENLPPLEAFAAGCPVVASRVAGAAEQLGDAALLADPHKPKEFAEAIVRLIREPNLREQLIARGHQRARRFTGDDFVRNVLEVVDEFEAVRSCWGKAA